MIETPEQFRAWRERHEFTQGEAAVHLGVSKRTVASYDSSGPIPLTVSLACEAITDRLLSAKIFEKLLREQHPNIGEFFLILPLTICGGAAYRAIVGIHFNREVEDWIKDNGMAATVCLKTIITFEGNRRDLAVIIFDNLDDATHFRLFWY